MKSETILRKIPNKQSPDDEFSEEMFRQARKLVLDEFDSVLDKDLLSGHDLIDMDGEWEEECISLDHFLATQMLPFY